MKININKKDMIDMINHSWQDISYREGGTYNKYSSTDPHDGDFIFDEKTATRVKNLIENISKQLKMKIG